MVIIEPTDRDLERTCTDVGADAFLMRPWAPKHFLTTVEELLNAASGNVDEEGSRRFETTPAEEASYP